MKQLKTNKDFIDMEHEVIELWNKEKYFEKLQKKNEGKKIFRFLDGPITANNPMGVHHARGRSLKDIQIRYKAMQGHHCHYRNGFDAQGLWVEVEVEKELGFKVKKDIEDFGLDKFTEKCKERVNKYSAIITEQSQRLGQWMDWENSYYTNTDENIENIWMFLKKCDDNGWIKESSRPLTWCTRCGTSLSEHEMTGSYKDIEHETIYFKLPIKGTDSKILVWTTTPWTLTANVALAVNADLDYVEVESEGEKLILAASRLSILPKGFKVIRELKGKELEGLEYEPVIPEVESQKNIEHKIVVWELANAEDGTGVVHIAPGCGLEDYELGEEIGLPKIMPIDETGNFYEGYSFLSGKNVSNTKHEIFDYLEKNNKVFKIEKYVHRYPVCWRCKSEVVFRLVNSYFIETKEIKPKLIEAARSVVWQPEYLGKNMEDWLENMGDWNISRQRYYGLPLPFYKCEHCGKLTVIGSKEELGAPIKELHRPWIDDIEITCECGKKVKRISSVGDVWLDAGIVPYSTLYYKTDKEKWAKYYPIEWISEMKEQVRLWFYSMLFMSTVISGRAPYEKVVGYDKVVSEDGTKFSKTGFMVKFDDAAEEMGADVIRYLFASTPLNSDVRFGFNLGDEVRRKIMSFCSITSFFDIYAEIDKPDITKVDFKNMHISDKWLINRTNEFIGLSEKTYENSDYSGVIAEFERFIDEVSNWYIRINRKRFWKSENDSDKANAFYSLFFAIKSMAKVMAPIVPFITEFVWQNTIKVYDKSAEESVHLSDYAKKVDFESDKDLTKKVDMVREITTLGLNARNLAGIKIKQPLNKIYLINVEKLDKEMESIIKDELNIKEIEISEFNSKFEIAKLEVNFREAGKVLKEKANAVKAHLASVESNLMQKYVEEFDNNDTIKMMDMDVLKVVFNKVNMIRDEYCKAEGNGIVIILDKTITPELEEEGIARELIRNCQLLRQEADFKVEQKIEVSLITKDETLTKVITKFKSYIERETLSKFVESIEKPVIEKELDNKVNVRMK